MIGTVVITVIAIFSEVLLMLFICAFLRASYTLEELVWMKFIST